jgi:hypothetical protein
LAIHGILHMTEVEWDRFQRDMGSIPEITPAELEAERAHRVLRDQMSLALLHGTFNEPTLRDIEAYFAHSIKPFIGAPATEETVDAITDTIIREAEAILMPCSHQVSAPETETIHQRRNGPEATP